ncbi:META domain-containing protein [Sinomicrobium weinanense]|uniref:META domain-containing protein n=1 Tax=Sinomicrobium weinanense TaxID=2842200 RepID=A0A926JUQ9_9FLAO|nr:META domain-containing protein [Sinomicrobium weinanense]MBC9797669.1 META domain-containing protein [Sinomicrobium weinanense]MBU3122649.1 META domain-containing protein [Sinomicrobium weinanense]
MKKLALFLSGVLCTSMVILSCNTAPKTDPFAALTSNTWMLETMEGKEVDSTSFARGVPYLDFDAEEMHVSGFAGCNRVTGGFAVEDKNGINLDKLATTFMACAGVDGEAGFLSVLRTVTNFEIEEKTLKFLSEEGEVMTFVPREE